MAHFAGLPLDDRGRLRCLADLRVEGVEDAWGAGDSCAVPDLTKPGECRGPERPARRPAGPACSPTTSSRTLRGEPLTDYRHKYAGSVASLGLHKGVAQVYGIKLKGWPAWFMHRTYHLSRVPTLNRKIRVVADWTLALFFKREIVSLGLDLDAVPRVRGRGRCARLGSVLRPPRGGALTRAAHVLVPGGRRNTVLAMRIPTALVTAGSLIGGWQVARQSGVRPLGGVVLGAGGLLAGREWARRTSPATTGALAAVYLGAFGVSHPLAKRIGAWPSVLLVSAVTAAASYVAADRRPGD